jgi:decaprenylphospho-beta-D-erythro-pentofuranosid-2-ulose 2-reductase
MENAFGESQTIVLLGGSSDIGQAIVRRLAGPTLRHVVLAARDPDACRDFATEITRAFGCEVTTPLFDAGDPASHRALVADMVAAVGDLDIVIMAFGVLGDQDAFDTDPGAAADAAAVNFVGSVSAGLSVAEQFRRQGHGRLVVMSSVAGERVRKANFVYGSTKAGLDGFAQGLGDALEGTGASVLVVRPGFVRSKMTEGLKPAPFATTPDAVADAVANGLRKHRRTVWVPGVLRVVFSVFRHLPGPIWRRLPI